MNIFKQVVIVRRGEVKETLSWDGDDAVVLESEFNGMKTTEEKTRAEAYADMTAWVSLIVEGRLEVLELDLELANSLMIGGSEWPVR